MLIARLWFHAKTLLKSLTSKRKHTLDIDGEFNICSTHWHRYETIAFLPLRPKAKKKNTFDGQSHPLCESLLSAQ
jgi:hypothetical protein